MIVVNTTCGWQVGDDLIREGALRVLGVGPDDPKYYVNRAQVLTSEGPAAYAARGVALPLAHDLMAGAKLFACAGTPEWYDLAEDWWAAALRHRVPIALVGVGCAQLRAAEVVRQAQRLGLIVGATARDGAALLQLASLGVSDVQWFPCPSTAGEWDRKQGKRVPLVLNPRLRCGPRPAGNAAFWLEGQGAEAVQGRNARVVVHEPDEVKAFADRFGFTPWYSSNPQDYRRLYERTEVYVGARLHGALPVAASGGTALLLPQAAKFEAAKRVAALAPGGSLRVLPAMAFSLGSDAYRQDPTPLLRALAEQSEQHAFYWSQRAARWRS